jgi:predicted dinucleotide-binding enzyme
VRVAETARWAEVIILAVPFPALDDVIREMGEGVNGKAVVDVTNLSTPDTASIIGTNSGAEDLQRKIPGAKVVKALNMVFSNYVEKGRIGGQQLTFFAAGDHKESKGKTLEMGRGLGFDPVDAGPLSNSRLLEALGNLNIQLGHTIGWNHGFRLVREESG